MAAESDEQIAADAIADDHELLISVAARLHRTSTVLLSRLDVPLTFRQYRTLTRVLGGYDSLRQLASRGNLSLPTVSENVDGLVKRGLMSTSPSETDKRAIVLHITEAGREAAAAARRAQGDFIASLLDGLSPEERAMLQSSLRTVYDAATIYFAERVVERGNRAG